MSKIIGNTTATPVLRSDWAQIDASKVDFILNKPTLGSLASKSVVNKTDLASAVQTSLNKADTAIQSLAGYATEEYVTTTIDNSVGAIPDYEIIALVADKLGE